MVSNCQKKPWVAIRNSLLGFLSDKHAALAHSFHRPKSQFRRPKLTRIAYSISWCQHKAHDANATGEPRIPLRQTPLRCFIYEILLWFWGSFVTAVCSQWYAPVTTRQPARAVKATKAARYSFC